MPKITKGGVTDVTVHEDYMAPAGVPPAMALDLGLDDQGGEQPSPGKTSSPQQRKPEPSTSKPSGDDSTPSTAPSTTGRSSGRRKGSTTAGSADT